MKLLVKKIEDICTVSFRLFYNIRFSILHAIIEPRLKGVYSL